MRSQVSDWLYIVAMLALIYKHVNKIGYKTAKRRVTMEIKNLTIAMIVLQYGRDPDGFFESKKERSDFFRPLLAKVLFLFFNVEL